MKPVSLSGELIEVSMIVEVSDDGRGEEVGIIGLFTSAMLMPKLDPFTRTRPRSAIATAAYGVYLLDEHRPGPFPLNVSLPAHREELRQSALAKLSFDEIEALGIKLK